MKEYQAKLNNSLCLDLTRDDKLIGRLLYKSWFKFDAFIELANNSTFPVEPKGFWGTTIEVKREGDVLLNFRMNWHGEILIRTYFNNVERGYILKHRGILKESFVLIDQDGTELAIMKLHTKWSKMNYEYQITTSDRFEILSNKDILLLTSLHCANYYISSVAAVVAAT